MYPPDYSQVQNENKAHHAIKLSATKQHGDINMIATNFIPFQIGGGVGKHPFGVVPGRQQQAVLTSAAFSML